ncbi:hypothetical protein HQ563_14990 [bacterium]|nr:hypothetical protein [bacterium]
MSIDLDLRKPAEPIELLRWLQEVRDTVLNQQRSPVFRTMLISKREYIDHILESEDWDGNSLSEDYVRPLEERLPDHAWMVEVSIPNLYTANRSKLGEILVDVDAPDPNLKKDLSRCWVGGRLPGVLFLPPEAVGAPPEPVSTPVVAHVPIYRLPRLRWMGTEW